MLRPCLVFTCLSLPAAAQEVDCANAMAQAEMNMCSYQEWQAADAGLNAAYKEAMALLKQWDADLPKDEQGAATALQEAQRAWITYRDNACEAEGFAMHGGTAEPLLVNGCLTVLTNERTAHLRGLIDSYGGM